MACHAAASILTSFSFYQGNGKLRGIGFLDTFKNPIYNGNNTRNDMKSQIKNKKNGSKSS